MSAVLHNHKGIYVKYVSVCGSVFIKAVGLRLQVGWQNIDLRSTTVGLSWLADHIVLNYFGGGCELNGRADLVFAFR